jgi:hypothetical protein
VALGVFACEQSTQWRLIIVPFILMVTNLDVNG